MKSLSPRARTVSVVVGSCIFFGVLLWGAWSLGNRGESPDFSVRNLPPSLVYPFGTDWLGRDVFSRTIKGLRLSLGVGLSAALCSASVAVVLGLAAATLGRFVDTAITWAVDVAMATPHLVLLILISFVCGGGAQGVIIAVGATHWPSLTRIVRAEVLQIRTAEYVQISRRLGKGWFFIATRHMLPHIVPQFLVGLILLFPHAILHAAGLTFLGFGMPPDAPDVGVLLAESMRYLSLGLWWLAVAPGLTLVVTVKVFDLLGSHVRALADPRTCRW